MAARMTIAIAAGVMAVGCTSQYEVVPDFSLEDVNETSARYTQDVSPQDYVNQVSAWYFGHAT